MVSSSLYMYINVCVRMDVCVYIHIILLVRLHVCMYVCTYTYTDHPSCTFAWSAVIHTNIHACTHIYIYVCMYVYTYTCMCMYVRVCGPCKSTRKMICIYTQTSMHARIFIYTYTQVTSILRYTSCTFAHACIHTHTHIRYTNSVYVCIHTRIHTYFHVYSRCRILHTRLYMHTYIHTYTTQTQTLYIHAYIHAYVHAFSRCLHLARHFMHIAADFISQLHTCMDIYMYTHVASIWLDTSCTLLQILSVNSPNMAPMLCCSSVAAPLRP